MLDDWNRLVGFTYVGPFGVLSVVDKAGVLFLIVEEGENAPGEKKSHANSHYGSHQTEADDQKVDFEALGLGLDANASFAFLLTETVDETHAAGLVLQLEIRRPAVHLRRNFI